MLKNKELYELDKKDGIYKDDSNISIFDNIMMRELSEIEGLKDELDLFFEKKKNSSDNRNDNIISVNNEMLEYYNIAKRQKNRTTQVNTNLNIENIKNEEDIETEEKETKLIGKKKDQGRKRMNCLDDSKKNAYSESNMISKIKAYLINTCMISWLNSNTINRFYKFYKIEGKDASCITIDDNLKLLNKKIKDILKTLPNSSKNKKNGKGNIYHNKELVEKIIRENKQKEVIDFLDLTFREFLYKFVNKELGLKYSLEGGFEDYLREYYEKREKNEKYIRKVVTNFEDYYNKVKQLAIGYEDWFVKKYPRESKKNTKGKEGCEEEEYKKIFT